MSHQCTEDTLKNDLLMKLAAVEDKDTSLRENALLIQSFEEKVLLLNETIVELKETLSLCGEELENRQVECLDIICSLRGQLVDVVERNSVLETENGNISTEIELNHVVNKVEVSAIANELCHWKECHGMLYEELQSFRQMIIGKKQIRGGCEELGVDDLLNSELPEDYTEKVEDALAPFIWQSTQVVLEEPLLEVEESSECKQTTQSSSADCNIDTRVNPTNEEKFLLLQEMFSMYVEDFQSFRIHVSLDHARCLLAVEKTYTDVLEQLQCDLALQNQTNNQLIGIISEKDTELSLKSQQIQQALLSEAVQVAAISVKLSNLLENVSLRCALY
jgi:hypothetical protein